MGGEDALLGAIDDVEEDICGWFAITVSNDYMYAFLAFVSPSDACGDYVTIFGTMLDSVEFFLPE